MPQHMAADLIRQMSLPCALGHICIQHYDVGELESLFKNKKHRLSHLEGYFRHLHKAIPACYILDYTRSRYIFGTENIRQFIDRPLSYFLDGGVELAVSLFHKKDLKVYSERVIVDNIRFIKDKPASEHENYLFKCNYRIRTNRGDYRNVLQQSIFIKSSDNGIPLATFGFLSDITHYRNDSKIVQTIEPIFSTPQNMRTETPVLFNTYFSEEKDTVLTPREIEVMKF